MLIYTFCIKFATPSDPKCIPLFYGMYGMYGMYVGQKKKPVYFNTNYHTEMTLAPINMDYCLLQLVDGLKIFLRGPSTWGFST